VKSGRFWVPFLAIFLFISWPAGAAADIKIPPSPDQWLTDTAGFLSSDAAGAVNNQLRTYEQATGHQVLVYIGKTSGGYSIEEYAVKAFEAWKVGRKGMDDGLVLFIMAEDRKIRIEVGYGLEGVVTDAKASQVINEILTPKIRNGDHDGAVREAVNKLQEIISGKISSPEEDYKPLAKPKGTSVFQTILVVIGIIFLLILFITHPSAALWLLLNLLSGGRGGGGSWGGGRGGGGFSGGGGRSGGGGASGGW
jgi:uncharacterized protein